MRMDTKRTVTLPTLMLVAATRGMLGAGLGMLLADRLGARRVRIGRALVAVGALSTIPLVLSIFRREPEDQYVDVRRFRTQSQNLDVTPPLDTPPIVEGADQ
ncbi:MAG: hypothetical protein ABI051_04100 [Vicinamibacterales bacterium]